MNERAIIFGRKDSLHGIVSTPNQQSANIGCILITAGLIPKFGPFRLYTNLARDIANLGITTLRFDLDSVGDSANCYSDMALQDRTIAEIKDAIDFLNREYTFERFILCGLCSGAEASARYAAIDSRVVAISMYDPFAFETKYSHRRYVRMSYYKILIKLLGLGEPISWRKKFRQVFTKITAKFGIRKNLAKSKKDSSISDGNELVEYEYMPKTEAESILSTLIARGVSIHFIYTAARYKLVNSASQMKAMFPDINLDSNVQIDMLSDMGHTPKFHHNMETMIGVVTKFLSSTVLPNHKQIN